MCKVSDVQNKVKWTLLIFRKVNYNKLHVKMFYAKFIMMIVLVHMTLQLYTLDR